MTTNKTCKRCEFPKSVNEFFERRPGVYRTECKQCSKELFRKAYEARKKRDKQEPESKVCAKCSSPKPISEFRRNPGKPDGRDSTCKSCMSEYYQSPVMKEYLKKRKESGRQKEVLDRYRSKHAGAIHERKRELRRSVVKPVRFAEAKVRAEFRKRAHEKMGGSCVRCGERKTSRLCIDHVNDDGNVERLTSAGDFRSIASRVLRGEVWAGKYQLMCFNCNARKRAESFIRDRNDSPEDGAKRKCTQCLIEKRVGCFSKDAHKSSGRKSECKLCTSFRVAIRKKLVIDELGGSCTRCGEDNLSCLEADHVNDDGAKLRKSGQDVGIHLKVFPGHRNKDGLQVLCASCNAEKAYDAVKAKAIVPVTEPVVRPEVKLEVFELREVSVSRVDFRDAEKLLNDHHYAKYGRSATAVYAAFLDDVMIAAVKLSTVIRKEVATSMGLTTSDVLELDRFCILPTHQVKNLASYVMKRVLKLMKRDFPSVKTVVSFADTAQGHVGTIYSASNWKRLGTTGKSYKYVGPSGNVLNKKTLYERAKRACMTEREYAVANSFTKVELPEKIKFSYGLR